MTQKRKPTHEQNVSNKNEGEGNKTAARNYNEATKQYAHSGKVDEAAKKAQKAINGPEGPELRRAEEQGKQAAKHA